MKPNKRHSYGVIPILRSSAGYRVLLVNQRESSQKRDIPGGYWTFAKGTPEDGETPLETAIRETAEEVGIKFTNVNPEPSFTNAYTFDSKGQTFNKEVTYFLGFVETETVSIQEDEIVEAHWFSINDARAQLTFEHNKILLDEVSAYLQNLDK